MKAELLLSIIWREVDYYCSPREADQKCRGRNQIHFMTLGERSFGRRIFKYPRSSLRHAPVLSFRLMCCCRRSPAINVVSQLLVLAPMENVYVAACGSRSLTEYRRYRYRRHQTKDNVFVTAVVSVQYQPIKEKVRKKLVTCNHCCNL